MVKVNFSDKGNQLVGFFYEDSDGKQLGPEFQSKELGMLYLIVLFIEKRLSNDDDFDELSEKIINSKILEKMTEVNRAVNLSKQQLEKIKAHISIWIEKMKEELTRIMEMQKKVAKFKKQFPKAPMIDMLPYNKKNIEANIEFFTKILATVEAFLN